MFAIKFVIFDSVVFNDGPEKATNVRHFSRKRNFVPNRLFLCRRPEFQRHECSLRQFYFKVLGNLAWKNPDMN